MNAIRVNSFRFQNFVRSSLRFLGTKPITLPAYEKDLLKFVNVGFSKTYPVSI